MAAEAEAFGLQRLRHLARHGRLGRHIGHRLPGVPARAEVDEAPEEAVEALARLDRLPGAGVGHGGLDLAAMAHDAGVGEGARHLRLAPAGEARGVEAVERGAEVLALPQDRQPAQPGLEAVEHELGEQRPAVGLGPAPLVVVIGDVERVGAAPRAALPRRPFHAGVHAVRPRSQPLTAPLNAFLRTLLEQGARHRQPPGTAVTRGPWRARAAAAGSERWGGTSCSAAPIGCLAPARASTG